MSRFISLAVICFVAVLAVAVSAAPVSPEETTSTARPDTTYLLGGPDRWDGSFETAAGEPDWHGWTHADLYTFTATVWQVSDFNAENLGGHGPGNLAAWCGTIFDNDCGPGYGNSWNGRLVWTGLAPDPEQSTEVRITARINVDVELIYDSVHLVVWRESSWQSLISWDGLHDDIEVDLSCTLDPEDYFGPQDDLLRLAWQVMSDGAWSDEDCIIDTDGACQIDDVVISLNGTPVFADDFQDGDLEGWEVQSGYKVGDFTQLWSGLDDLDPDHQNDSWQVVFFDDGVVVPGTGGTACGNWCYGPDGWVYNVDAGLFPGIGLVSGPLTPPFWNSGVWNGVISPSLAWPEGTTSAQLAFDVYAHMPTFECGFMTYGWTVRATGSADPEDLDLAEWAPTRWSYWNPETMPEGPGYFRITGQLDDLLPMDVCWLQVRLEVIEVGPWCWGEFVSRWESTPAPYFDNVAVSAWTAVTDVPTAPAELSISASPNPFNPITTLQYALPAEGHLRLTIHDLQGRRIAGLLDEWRPAGHGTVVWRGLDDRGAAVASGIYFARMETTGEVRSAKLTLVR